MTCYDSLRDTTCRIGGDWSAVESRFAPNHGGYCAETAERCGATADDDRDAAYDLAAEEIDRDWAELFERLSR